MRKKISLWLNRPKNQGTLSVRRKKEKEMISSPFKSPCAEKMKVDLVNPNNQSEATPNASKKRNIICNPNNYSLSSPVKTSSRKNRNFNCTPNKCTYRSPFKKRNKTKNMYHDDKELYDNEIRPLSSDSEVEIEPHVQNEHYDIL